MAMAATGEPVAVLGIGTMGHGMVDSALRAGITVIVWDRHREAAAVFGDRGAEVAETAAEAAGRAGIVVTMVTDADAVLSVATEQGMLGALAPDAIWIQMSTIGLAGTGARHVARRGAVRRHLLDAPVSGSKEPAEHGELTIFASGPDELRPVSRRCSTRWASGPSGSGLWGGDPLKLVNNTLLAFTNEGVVASIALAPRRLGPRTQTCSTWLNGGPLLSPWESAEVRAHRPRRLLGAIRVCSHSRTCTSRSHRRRRQVRGACRPGARMGTHCRPGLGDQDLTVVTRALEAPDNTMTLIGSFFLTLAPARTGWRIRARRSEPSSLDAAAALGPAGLAVGVVRGRRARLPGSAAGSPQAPASSRPRPCCRSAGPCSGRRGSPTIRPAGPSATRWPPERGETPRLSVTVRTASSTCQVCWDWPRWFQIRIPSSAFSTTRAPAGGGSPRRYLPVSHPLASGDQASSGPAAGRPARSPIRPRGPAGCTAPAWTPGRTVRGIPRYPLLFAAASR